MRVRLLSHARRTLRDRNPTDGWTAVEILWLERDVEAEAASCVHRESVGELSEPNRADSNCVAPGRYPREGECAQRVGQNSMAPWLERHRREGDWSSCIAIGDLAGERRDKFRVGDDT
jgi:hypothetical protein